MFFPIYMPLGSPTKSPSDLKKTLGSHDLEVSMVGLKLGASVLQLGGRNAQLIAALAKVVGISGEACAVIESAKEADRIQRAAVKAGVLVDVKTASFGALPFDPESFDVVVAPDLLGELSMNERVVCLLQALRVLRPGGRCVVIEKVPRRGLGALFSRRTLDSTYVENGGARGAFEAAGCREVRHLGDGKRRRFYEGTRK